MICIPNCMCWQISAPHLKLHPYRVAVTKKINLCSKCRENELQVLTKTGITYEWSNVQTWNLHHHVCHELRNGLLDKWFLLFPCIATNKSEIHEETLITNNHFNVTWINGHNLWFLWCTVIKDFQAPLALANKMIPRFRPLAPSFTKLRACKDIDFQNIQYLSSVCQSFILKNMYCPIVFGFHRSGHILWVP